MFIIHKQKLVKQEGEANTLAAASNLKKRVRFELDEHANEMEKLQEHDQPSEATKVFFRKLEAAEEHKVKYLLSNNS